MMRPGAEFVPFWVWHELQFPAVCMDTIAREAPALLVSFAENGVLSAELL